jgi:hypothetical protein
MTKRQAEGVDARVSRINAAFQSIESAKYTGRTRGFTLDDYIERHQKAHTELLILERPVPDEKKVQDFINGITDPKFSIARGIVLSSAVMQTNFTACQLFYKTFSINDKAMQPAAETRTVAKAAQGSGKSSMAKHKKKGKGKEGAGSSGKKLHAGFYNSTDYSKLSATDKAEVMRLRKVRDEAATQDTDSGRDRTLAATEAEPTVAAGPTGAVPNARRVATVETAPAGAPAGDQFGRAGHVHFGANV